MSLALSHYADDTIAHILPYLTGKGLRGVDVWEFLF